MVGGSMLLHQVGMDGVRYVFFRIDELNHVGDVKTPMVVARHPQRNHTAGDSTVWGLREFKVTPQQWRDGNFAFNLTTGQVEIGPVPAPNHGHPDLPLQDIEINMPGPGGLGCACPPVTPVAPEQVAVKASTKTKEVK